MSSAKTIIEKASSFKAADIPVPVLVTLRGIGQVFFQENALTGALFVVGIALNSPWMALGTIVGSAIGMATARVLKYDESEVLAGIYGFNSALVAMATIFFFQPGVVSIGLLLVGSVAAAVVTWAVRKYLPFPTYTAPFIVVTWVLYFLGQGLGATAAPAGEVPVAPGFIEATKNGIGQVMFQGSVWSGLFFLVGIAISNREHAGWVVLGSALGMMVGLYHNDSAQEIAGLGLYGYNATLAAVALFLWRRSLIWPLLGIVLSVPITEYFPMVGLPTLTVPFVLATWLVLVLGWLETRLFGPPAPVTR